MLKFLETVRVLHLEPTDVCQAACPQCARELDPAFDKKIKHYLTVPDLQRILPDSVIRRLDKMYMCGNYGDPAASEALSIVDHFRNINSSITIGMNTNGGIQASWWWKALGERLKNPLDYVVFSVDGLEDTNHIYRKNVVWERVIANAEAFIRAGGAAHWDMLVFEHNQHQVDACEQLARKLGFKFFRAKVSRRHNEYPVQFLKQPAGWQDPVTLEGNIKCLALEENSLYISAKGTVHPCCWLGASDGADINEFVTIQENWKTNPNAICKKTCSTNNVGSSFTNQWQREVQLF